jgi:bifunctional non-homologous end joining protein LigD
MSIVDQMRKPSRSASGIARERTLDRREPQSQIPTVLKRNPFIIPSAPVLRREPPTGAQWLHEVKFDGWRAQLHKAGDEIAIFTRKGHDYTKRFPAIRDSLLALPTHSAIIDAEIVVCDSDGKPDFQALMEGATGDLCAWCFDLLELNGRGLRRRTLIERKAMLRHLLSTISRFGRAPSSRRRNQGL